MLNTFDITEFGAVADCKTDCTAAIQNALDEAGKVRGTVIVPPGEYCCGYIKVPESVCLQGSHGWGYRDKGGSRLILCDENAKCLLDLTGGHGSMVKGLQLIGGHLGKEVHGMLIDWKLYNGNGAKFFDGYTTDFHEDSFVIDDCQIRDFSGDAAHLNKVFAFTIRNCHFILNGGSAIWIDGWDGWITNSIFSFNGKYALYGDNICSSLTITGNRIEWNRLGGFCLGSGGSIIINSNAFDRNMGPAIKLTKDCGRQGYVITSNNFWRNGKPRSTPFEDEYDSSHIYIDGGRNVIISNNIMQYGKDDGGGGVLSPDYAVVVQNADDCIVKDNAVTDAAVKKCYVI